MDLHSLVLFAEETAQYADTTTTTAGSSVVSILIIIATWLIFNKAGEKGWKAIIPFYSTYTLYKLIWGNGWKFLLLLIPIYNIVLHIQSMIKLSHKFGKSTGFGWGLALLNVIFMCILAFGSAQYQGEEAAA